jgi:TonB family protein
MPRAIAVAFLILATLGAGLSSRAQGADRGGIEGDPIGLDWVDARYSDFIDQVKRRIEARLDYPCVRDPAKATCEPLNAQLVVEFGILNSGRVQYVSVVRSSGLAVYDESAARAIWAASPLPPIPPQLVREGSTGLPIRSQFTYVMHSRPRPPAAYRSVPGSAFVTAGILAAVAVMAAMGAWMLRRRRTIGPATVSESERHRASTQPPREGRSEPSPAAVAHTVLLSHGWIHEGDAVARSYLHPGLQGHRVNVSPAGDWEHTKMPGMPARGSTPEELAQHLGAIHGTLSIADLHLPGRRAE